MFIGLILKKKVIRYLQTKSLDDEENMVLRWLEKNIFSSILNRNYIVFPYAFTQKYNKNQVKVLFNDLLKRRYVIIDNKKMYFKKNMSEGSIKKYVNQILLEQDSMSPHKYSIDKTSVKNKVVADLGAAEGIFALSIIEDVKKIYLFECDNDWIEALNLTFEPWKERVVIVNKFVSNINSENKITVDEYFKDKNIDLIKADIEGSEVAMLEGGRKTFKYKVSEVLLCAYHKATDEQDIKRLLREYGYDYRMSNGYMIFIYDDKLNAPYLRRGMVYGKNISL
jgi:hypothetical protein